MKRRILAFLLTALTVFAVCGASFVSAEAVYAFTEDTSKAYEVVSGVRYREFALSSGVYEVTASASVLEFGMKDYMILSYSGTAGGSGTLNEQYELAKADGYDVVAVINGDFFSVGESSYGYLNEYVVSNGVIVSADNDNPANDFDGVVAIGTDGSLNSTLTSKLHFGLYFNGMEVNGGIAAVNKTGGGINKGNWGDRFYYFDARSGDKHNTDIVSKALTYGICPGYEVLCKKKNGTDLTINGSLEAEVVSVKADTYGGAIGKDEFILFVKTDSPFADQAAALKKGDSVTVTASETNADAAKVTENAVSVMANVGYLVKDGVDQTAIKDTIGSHSVTLPARWTAFGKKEDGSFVFFTSEGGTTGEGKSPTLKDVAKAMSSLGCKDVIRLDGGGSSAMYVCDDGSGKPGFKQSSSRDVGNCVLLVRRSSEALQVPESLKNDVQNLAEEAKTKTDEYAKAAAAAADKLLKDTTAVYGSYLTVYMKLRYALSGKNQLGDLMGTVAGVIFKDYSEFVLGKLREAYGAASAVFGSASASASDVQKAYDELNKWYLLKGDVTIDGKEYKKITDGIYLTGMNLSILTGYSCIYTPGTDVTGVNLNWSQVLLVRRKDKDSPYVVELNFFGNGNAAAIFSKLGFNVVPEDCLVFGVHGDDSGESKDNRNLAANAQKGQVLNLFGIDLEIKTSGVGAYFSFTDPAPEFKKGDIDGDGDVTITDYLMVKAQVLGTREFDAEVVDRMNVNGDKKPDGAPNIDIADYLLVKKIVLEQ